MVSNINTRLIAAVQRSAGSRCHQAANLLQSYGFAAELLQRLGLEGDSPEAQEVREVFVNSEVALRRFLFECRNVVRPELGGRERRLHGPAKGFEPVLVPMVGVRRQMLLTPVQKLIDDEDDEMLNRGCGGQVVESHDRRIAAASDRDKS